jgi:hypothetical protein
MPNDQAGIYFEKKKAGPAYVSLPSDKRDQLCAYLRLQMASFARPGRPGNQQRILEKHRFEWAPGYFVYWRLVLGPRESVESVVRLSAYRIEVLHIQTP